VLEDFKGVSVIDLNAAAARALAGKRAEFLKREKEAARKEVRQLLGLMDPVPPATLVGIPGLVKRAGYKIGKMRFELKGGIPLPALDFVPDNLGFVPTKPAVLYLHSNSNAVDAAPGGPIEKWMKAGHIVISVDLRGIGETAPGILAKGRPNYLGVDQKEAFLGLHLQRPLLGQRVQDVLAVLGALKSEVGFHLVGVDAAGPVALHAAALAPQVKGVTLERSLVSWSAVVSMPITHNQLTNAVPGVLKVYDLPDLAGLIAPRPLTIRAAVDPVQRPVSQAELEKAYAPCRAAYKRTGAEERLTLQTAP
jgi:pimeloyl-ACP methyl ester carboxylesterase